MVDLFCICLRDFCFFFKYICYSIKKKSHALVQKKNTYYTNYSLRSKINFLFNQIKIIIILNILTFHTPFGFPSTPRIFIFIFHFSWFGFFLLLTVRVVSVLSSHTTKSTKPREFSNPQNQPLCAALTKFYISSYFPFSRVTFHLQNVPFRFQNCFQVILRQPSRVLHHLEQWRKP